MIFRSKEIVRESYIIYIFRRRSQKILFFSSTWSKLAVLIESFSLSGCLPESHDFVRDKSDDPSDVALLKSRRLFIEDNERDFAIYAIRKPRDTIVLLGVKRVVSLKYCPSQRSFRGAPHGRNIRSLCPQTGDILFGSVIPRVISPVCFLSL